MPESFGLGAEYKGGGKVHAILPSLPISSIMEKSGLDLRSSLLRKTDNFNHNPILQLSTRGE